MAITSEQKFYLQELKTGNIPDTRPHFNGLDDDIKKIEAVLLGSKGNLAAIENTIDILLKKNSALAQLAQIDPVAEVPPIPEIPALPENASLPYVPLEQVSPWIANYIGYSLKASPEGYKDFHLACALFVLSTVTARRVCIPLASPMYTPLTFVMCARTTLFAKSTTAYAAIRVIKDANLSYLLGADETTPQKLLYDMAGHVPTNYGEMEPDRQEVTRHKLAMAAQRGWYYDEFNQLIDAMSKKGGGTMSDFAGLLRKLDNCADEYTYATKGGGEDYIEKPYLALLASTTPANMARHMAKGAELWGDGTCARWLFACPPTDGFITATMDLGTVTPPLELIAQLQRLHSWLGVPKCYVSEITNEKGDSTGKYQVERETLPERRVTLRPDAYKAYDRYRVAMRQLSSERSNSDLDGNYSRLPTFAMRVAAMLAVLENEGVLDIAVWTAAQQIMETFRVNLHEAYNQTSVDNALDESPLEDMLITHLKTLNSQPTTVREILRDATNKLRRLKSSGIRELLVNLERSGIVCMKREGKKECYTLCN